MHVVNTSMKANARLNTNPDEMQLSHFLIWLSFDLLSCNCQCMVSYDGFNHRWCISISKIYLEINAYRNGGHCRPKHQIQIFFTGQAATVNEMQCSQNFFILRWTLKMMLMPKKSWQGHTTGSRLVKTP